MKLIPGKMNYYGSIINWQVLGGKNKKGKFIIDQVYISLNDMIDMNKEIEVDHVKLMYEEIKKYIKITQNNEVEPVKKPWWKFWGD